MLRNLLAATALVTMSAAPALAGEDVLYDPAPAWVMEQDMAELVGGKGPSQLLWDWQYRLEDGVEYAYVDRAVRIDNPEMQMQQNQLQLAWLPDKGDLTVHRLELHRDGEILDLIADGVTFEILRRERGLEQRLLDGELTATVSVPGLRVGDVLRISHTVSTDDQALGEEVQALQYLYTEPWQVAKSRAVMSWPSDAEMYWRVEDRVALDEPATRDGYTYLTVDMPLAEPDPIPNDAPYRFRRPSVLRVGSFASWNEVSAVMAPHFAEAAKLEDGSEVAAQARAIMARTRDPLERAAMAVKLVQEEVSYLLDGLDGGNYLPQAADQTWAVRYGDCKAKTVLLLAMLREMGIASEAVLVSTQAGDAVPEVLPLPAAFDHVIVHAKIGGKDYWLDGTMTGTRLSTLADVPNFQHALPIRAGGAGLVPMVQRDPATPQMTMTVEIDHSAGVDIPALMTMTMKIVGPAGTPMRAMVDESNPSTIRQLAKRFASADDGLLVSDFSIAYDEEDAVALMTIEGLAPVSFEWKEGKLRAETEEFDAGDGFSPDRARPAWRAIPVATYGPARQRMDMRLVLPDGGKGYRLEGNRAFEGGYGNVRVTRQADIADGVMSWATETFMLPGEIAAADLPEAKRAARRLAGETLELVPPENVTWRWQLSAEERAKRIAPHLEAYDDAVAFADEDDFEPLQERALFKLNMYDFEAARADFDLLLRDWPSAWAHQQRAFIHQALGDNDAAITDLQAAYDLEPNNGIAGQLARRLAYGGKLADAQKLMDSLPVGEDDKVYYTDTLAEVLALDGDIATAQGLLEELVFDQPQNASALNGDCWFRGLFNVALDTAMERCTQAVERASNPAAALDSRALIHFRSGRYDAALADLDAVLQIAPAQAESLYLRGIVRLHAGDAKGRADIAEALVMAPHLPVFYNRHGIAPPR